METAEEITENVDALQENSTSENNCNSLPATSSSASMWQFVPVQQNAADPDSRRLNTRECVASQRKQLVVRDRSAANAHLFNPYYFMYATLVSGPKDEEIHLLKDGRTRATTGSIVSSLHRLKDLNGKDGAFFVFADLSVRMEGTYKLKFSLFEIINSEILFCSSIVTDSFNVYAAKKFPGMRGSAFSGLQAESTLLSRAFADQGLKIRIRKESRAKKVRKRSVSPSPEPPDSANQNSRKSSRKESNMQLNNSAVPSPAPPVANFYQLHPSQQQPEAALPQARFNPVLRQNSITSNASKNSYAVDGSQVYPYGSSKLWGSPYPPPQLANSAPVAQGPQPGGSYVIYGSGQLAAPSQPQRPDQQQYVVNDTSSTYHIWQQPSYQSNNPTTIVYQIQPQPGQYFVPPQNGQQSAYPQYISQQSMTYIIPQGYQLLPVQEGDRPPVSYVVQPMDGIRGEAPRYATEQQVYMQAPQHQHMSRDYAAYTQYDERLAPPNYYPQPSHQIPLNTPMVYQQQPQNPAMESHAPPESRQMQEVADEKQKQTEEERNLPPHMPPVNNQFVGHLPPFQQAIHQYRPRENNS